VGHDEQNYVPRRHALLEQFAGEDHVQAMETGMNTEVRLTRPSLSSIGSIRSYCHVRRVSTAEDTKLARSMMAIDGLSASRDACRNPWQVP
jgi:hypothetical protein